MENIRNKDTRPMMDLVAKKVFSNTEVTAQFIRDLLELPVASVKLLDGAQIHAKPYKDLLPFVTHVDVLAELDDGTQVIIEIQVAMQVDFIKRLWLYICEQVSQNLDDYKKEGVDTHYLSQELIPVYAIAITEKSYFGDNRAIHTFSMRDDENCEELKVKFKGIKEKRNLIRMVFLEIEKYRENTMENYKKVRWIEFFGNKPYTHEPEKIMKQADSIINPRKWSKEEKSMFDERRRDFDGYYAHLAYVKEEKEQAIAEGLQQGIERGIEQGLQQGIERGIGLGIEQGRMKELVDLVKEGLLTREIVAKKLKLSEEELEAYL
ncbi:Rpn family recombination-promoting nuclease/putative transposase [Gemella sp.]